MDFFSFAHKEKGELVCERVAEHHQQVENMHIIIRWRPMTGRYTHIVHRNKFLSDKNKLFINRRRPSRLSQTHTETAFFFDMEKYINFSFQCLYECSTVAVAAIQRNSFATSAHWHIDAASSFIISLDDESFIFLILPFVCLAVPTAHSGCRNSPRVSRRSAGK